jgi:PPM family protein phosphatase
MVVVSAVRTDIGRRRAANEDFFAADVPNGLFVVADGLGGHVAGRTASETAVKHFVEELAGRRGAGSVELLRLAMRASNGAILERAERQPFLRGMGTTLNALWVQQGRAILAHVGDSRTYLMRGGKLHSLTLDHSVVCELIFRRELDEEGARRHPNRHVITRALGVAAGVEPDVAEFEVERGDVFLLCTDGVTGPIPHGELRALLAGAAGALQGTLDRLIDLANARGGHDNATAILVELR